MTVTKRPESPTNTEIPASTTADYRGNFGLTGREVPFAMRRKLCAQVPQKRIAATASAMLDDDDDELSQ